MTDDELEAQLVALRARAQRLEDVESIKKLHRTYVRQLADRRWDDMPGMFTADAVVDLRSHGPRRGHAQIAELFGAMRAAGNPPDGYVLSSPVIDVDGDFATGTWTWHRHLCEFPVMDGVVRVFGPWWEGRYRCAYRREAGQWKFATMRFRLVAPDREAEPEAEAGEADDWGALGDADPASRHGHPDGATLTSGAGHVS
jgi:ketosteroid isomerase-like protein